VVNQVVNRVIKRRLFEPGGRRVCEQSCCFSWSFGLAFPSHAPEMSMFT
jgi:hypothetical protein